VCAHRQGAAGVKEILLNLVLLLQIQFGWKKQSGKSSTCIVVSVVAMD
jgi:hypothetical protein